MAIANFFQSNLVHTMETTKPYMELEYRVVSPSAVTKFAPESDTSRIHEVALIKRSSL